MGLLHFPLFFGGVQKLQYFCVLESGVLKKLNMEYLLYV